MARLPFIAGNWKMNKTVREAVDLVRELKTSLSGAKGVEVAVAPPFTALFAVHQEIEGSPIYLAAQNLYWEEKGAFTGEISPIMLKEVGCQYVIIGHSERRQFSGETDEGDLLRGRDITGEGRGKDLLRDRKTDRRRVERIGRPGDQKYGDRLRAGLGHRNREDSHARTG